MKHKRIISTLLAPVFAMTMLTGCDLFNGNGINFESDINKAGFIRFKNVEEFDFDGELSNKIDEHYEENANKLVGVSGTQASLEYGDVGGAYEQSVLELSFKVYKDAISAVQKYEQIAATDGYEKHASLVANITTVNAGEDCAYAKIDYDTAGTKYSTYEIEDAIEDAGLELMGQFISIDASDGAYYAQVDGKHCIFTYTEELTKVTKYDTEGVEFTFYRLVKEQFVLVFDKNYAPAEVYGYSEKYVDHNLATGLAYADWAPERKEVLSYKVSYGEVKDFPNKDEFLAAVPDGFVRNLQVSIDKGRIETDSETGDETFAHIDYSYEYKYDTDVAKETDKFVIKKQYEAGETDMLFRIRLSRQYRYLKGEHIGDDENIDDEITAAVALAFGLQVHTIGDVVYMVLPAGETLDLNFSIVYNTTSIAAGTFSIVRN